MRLDPQHIAAIKRLVAEQFGAGTRVRLFGSRLDDDARGGDVDLLVELDAPVAEPGVANAKVFGAREPRDAWAEGRRCAGRAKPAHASDP